MTRKKTAKGRVVKPPRRYRRSSRQSLAANPVPTPKPDRTPSSPPPSTLIPSPAASQDPASTPNAAPASASTPTPDPVPTSDSTPASTPALDTAPTPVPSPAPDSNQTTAQDPTPALATAPTSVTSPAPDSNQTTAPDPTPSPALATAPTSVTSPPPDSNQKTAPDPTPTLASAPTPLPPPTTLNPSDNPLDTSPLLEKASGPSPSSCTADEPTIGDNVHETVLNVRLVEDDKVEVTLKRLFSASVKCPCSSECEIKMMVGTYGHMGKGQSMCEHCGSSPGRSGWPSIAELKKHVETNRCRKERGLSPKHTSAKKQLGDVLVEQINKRAHIKLKENAKFYMCYKCKTDVIYKDRFQHSIVCFKAKEIKFPIGDGELESHLDIQPSAAAKEQTATDGIRSSPQRLRRSKRPSKQRRRDARSLPSQPHLDDQEQDKDSEPVQKRVRTSKRARN